MSHSQTNSSRTPLIILVLFTVISYTGVDALSAQAPVPAYSARRPEELNHYCDGKRPGWLLREWRALKRFLGRGDKIQNDDAICFREELQKELTEKGPEFVMNKLNTDNQIKVQLHGAQLKNTLAKSFQAQVESCRSQTCQSSLRADDIPLYLKNINNTLSVPFLYAEPSGVSEGYSIGEHTYFVLQIYNDQKGPYQIEDIEKGAIIRYLCHTSRK